MAADTYAVERSITIDAPPERIYDQIADFRSWPGWSPWEDVEATPASKVRRDLFFEKPWKAHNDTHFTILPTESGSRVTWWMSGRKTLMTKVMGIFKSMDDFLGPDFERGLARLKANAENSTNQ